MSFLVIWWATDISWQLATMRGSRTVTAGIGFALSISNEGMDDILSIKRVARKFRCIDRVTETVKHETKEQGGRFLALL